MNNQIQREAEDSTGALQFSEMCWDGRRRVTAKVHPRSKLNPIGGVSYLQRFISSEALNTAVRAAEEGAPRWACDFL